MKSLQQNVSLKPFHTFGTFVMARWFGTFSDADELEELFDREAASRVVILGGGSNVLFTRDFDGLVLKNEVSGITELHEDTEFVYVRAGAGENWHRFVLYCISRNWGGLENLSLIPGNVGASPMQNIGAYGVEADDVFWDLEAWHIKEKRKVTFTRSDCEFGYRHSVFKGKFKDQFVILNVTFQLRKKPRLNIMYGAIEQELEKMGVQELSVKAVSDAVIRIRRSKLPDPAEIGNAGSFFKNPVISADHFRELKDRFGTMVGYETVEGSVKLAAGWLIEQCGPDANTSWKGYLRGDAGCYDKQALVLVNYGTASGQEILLLSEEIKQSVSNKFGITLEREVNVF